VDTFDTDDGDAIYPGYHTPAKYGRQRVVLAMAMWQLVGEGVCGFVYEGVAAARSVSWERTRKAKPQAALTNSSTRPVLLSTTNRAAPRRVKDGKEYIPVQLSTKCQRTGIPTPAIRYYFFKHPIYLDNVRYPIFPLLIYITPSPFHVD